MVGGDYMAKYDLNKIMYVSDIDVKNEDFLCQYAFYIWELSHSSDIQSINHSAQTASFRNKRFFSNHDRDCLLLSVSQRLELEGMRYIKKTLAVKNLFFKRCNQLI